MHIFFFVYLVIQPALELFWDISQRWVDLRLGQFLWVYFRCQSFRPCALKSNLKRLNLFLGVADSTQPLCRMVMLKSPSLTRSFKTKLPLQFVQTLPSEFQVSKRILFLVYRLSTATTTTILSAVMNLYCTRFRLLGILRFLHRRCGRYYNLRWVTITAEVWEFFS